MSDQRYQDLVIKNGQFIGRFEEMYRQFPDPWRQSQPEHNTLSVSRNIAMLTLARYQVRSVVEFGCGLGHYTDFLRRSLGIRVLGVDISPTAITKARGQFPRSEFAVDDVSNIARYPDFDAVLFAEITWYILPRLREVFAELLRSFPKKYFFHNLAFYKGDTQRYGRDYFASLDEFIDYCPFRLLERAEHTTTEPGSGLATSTVFQIEPK